MAQQFELPHPWPSDGWSLKIRDRERLEPPHVSLMRRTRTWRFALREQAFLDREPDPREVPARLVRHLISNSARYGETWDKLYPENPVNSTDTPSANEDPN